MTRFSLPGSTLRALFASVMAASAVCVLTPDAQAQGEPPATPPAAPADAPAAAPATDGELPVAVLTIQTLDAFEQADALTSALKTAVEQADGWSYQNLGKDQALLFLISSLGCNDPPDEACEQKIGDELKVDRFVWGTLAKENTEIVGQLHLWTRGTGRKTVQFRFAVGVVVPGDSDFIRLVQEKFEEIAGPPPSAKLTIKAGTVSGTVMVDGKEAGKIVGGTATIDVPKGSHRIVIVADGYEDMETTVDMKAREERSITLMPVQKSGGVDVQKVLGFTAIGLGVAAAGVATYAGVRVLQINSDLEPLRLNTEGQYFFTPKEGDTEFDGCDPGDGSYPHLEPNDPSETRDGWIDLCKEGKTMQTLTLAMWPVAGALAGTGIILLATADWSGSGKEQARLPWILVPNFGPHGGDITFATQF